MHKLAISLRIRGDSSTHHDCLIVLKDQPFLKMVGVTTYLKVEDVYNSQQVHDAKDLLRDAIVEILGVERYQLSIYIYLIHTLWQYESATIYVPKDLYTGIVRRLKIRNLNA
jgi:hypothetical protein